MMNRHGKSYTFKQLDANRYQFVGDTRWARFGGQVGGTGVDYSNLGFFDPAGGPFIAPGFLVYGKPVQTISVVNDKVILEVGDATAD